MHNLFLLYFVKLYMFRAYLGPSSGGTTVCIQQVVLTVLFRLLSVVFVGLESNQNNFDDCPLFWLIWNPTRTTLMTVRCYG